MSASTQAFVCLLGALLLAVLIAISQRPTTHSGTPVGERISTGLKIDPNTADAATLTLLPGIGPGIAEHVIETRESGVVFERVEDLRAVRFVGPSVISRVSPWVDFAGASPEAGAAVLVAEVGQ